MTPDPAAKPGETSAASSTQPQGQAQSSADNGSDIIPPFPSSGPAASKDAKDSAAAAPAEKDQPAKKKAAKSGGGGKKAGGKSKKKG
jgi:hypothetical protein